MSQRFISALMFGLGAVTAANAFDIDGVAPKVHFNGITNSKFPGLQAQFEEKMNGEVKVAFDNSIASAKDKLKGFKEQKELAQGMANANAYSSNSATLQGFQNYDLFAVSSGFMLGVQAPSLDPGSYETIGDDISEKGDLYAGIGAGFTYLNVGINAKFLLPGLYLNAKYGGLSQDIGDFSLDFRVMGVGVNYKVLEPKSLIGLVKWRGISVGTGFYMQTDKLNMKITPDTIKTDADFRNAMLAGASGQDSLDKEAILLEMGYGPGSKDAQVLLSPEFDMGLDISTFTIPLEANTAVSILWGLLNVTAGAGVDVNFGSAKIVLEGASDANIKGNSDKVTFDKATVNVDGSSDNGPSFLRPRLMTGVGLGLGPVKLDIPLVWYLNSGVAMGLTAAVVW
jgi:hypothetical protein